ncbi:hypothetical protein A9Z40_03215 [Microbacterium arborescens]|uniref:Uncharacterized protein n=1 Tax=Microbacterium arborescens TaxID=33883 RepID=A0ABX2WIB6_9MICO|nr:hypothetical protein [Microbacterium arborescens]OAZ40965.1 hypothetical protein A9Z40_03215 [Microbacterium arborescens]
MIVDTQHRSRTLVSVDLLLRGRDACCEEVRRELWQDIARSLEREAAVEADDVWVWRGEPALHGDVYEGVWAPDPQRGVELRGGPLDGQRFALPRWEGPGDGLPRFRVSLPVGMPDTVDEFALATGPVPVPTAMYERAGIDPAARCFVYRYVL